MLYKITVLSLAIWWGMFAFFAFVVIPIGGQAVDSSFDMGVITHSLAHELNFFGMLVFIIYAYYTKSLPQSPQQLFYNLTAAILIGGQLFLFLMHYHIEDLLDTVHRKINYILTFHDLNFVYRITCLVLWVVVTGTVAKMLFGQKV